MEVYLCSGKKREAAEALGRMCELDPDNVDFLGRRRNLLKEAGDTEPLITVCSRIVELDPSDLATWELLADRLLSAGRKAEAVAAFESILELKPECPRASFFVAEARHDRAVEAGTGDWSEIVQLLDRVLSADAAASFSPPELNLAKLYRCSARLSADARDPDAEAALAEIPVSRMEPSRLGVLARCYVLLGDAAREAGRLDGALSAYKTALVYQDRSDAHERLADIFAERADALHERKKYRQARDHYALAVEHRPGDVSLRGKRLHAGQNYKHQLVLRGGLVLLVAVVGAIVLFVAGFGKTTVSVKVSPPPDGAKLMSGDQVLASIEGGSDNTLESAELRFGRYRLRVEKEGYEPVDMAFWAKIGGGSQNKVIELKPVYGGLKINSDPTGAAVTVRNRYEEKTGTTPCELSGLFAMTSTVQVAVSGLPPYQMEQTIPAGEVLDLGIIRFHGSIKVDSNPSGAEVFVNGENKGVTPLQVDELPAGAVTVELRHAKAGTYSREVDVVPQQVTDLGLMTLASLGVLRVDSNPSQADVHLDGTKVAVTPAALENLSIGPHRLSIALKGYATYETDVNAEVGAPIDLGIVELKKQEGLPRTFKRAKLPPVDEGAKDASFAAFRTELLRALAKRDTKYLLGIVYPDIRVGFGEDNGLERFRKAWQLDNAGDKSPIWQALGDVLRLGGTWRDSEGGSKQFWAPYVFTKFPEKYDAYTFRAITGTDVNVRSKPDPRSAVVSRLSNEVVLVIAKEGEKEKMETIKGETYPWVHIRMSDGKEGYVFGQYLCSPTGLRACFEKRNDKWLMTALVAGD